MSQKSNVRDVKGTKEPKHSESQTQAGPEGPHFTIHNIYVKDISFEAPKVPHIFNDEWKPKLDFDLQMNSEPLPNDLYDVTVHLTLKVSLPEDKPAYLIEVQQAGVFSIKGFPQDILQKILATTCPEILFPYLRELISSLVARGGFPQLMLPPMNFEAMYAQYLTTKESKDQEGKTAEGQST